MKRINLIFLFLSISIAQCLAKEINYPIDQKLTQSAHLKPDSVVFSTSYKNNKDNSEFGVYRKFIGITKDGYYLVQDFYTKDNRMRTTPYQTNKNGVSSNNPSPQNGLFSLFYESGMPRSEMHYKNGKLDGNVKFWHDNGRIVTQGLFKDGIAIGNWVGWYENGDNFFQINIIRNSKETLLDFPFEEGNNSLKLYTSIDKENLERLFSAEVLHENGGKLIKVDSLSHKKNKTLYSWDEKGNLMSEMVLTPSEELTMYGYATNGQKTLEVITIKNKGYMQTMWNEKGQKLMEQFLSDEKNKKEKSYMKMWDENGNLITETIIPDEKSN